MSRKFEVSSSMTLKILFKIRYEMTLGEMLQKWHSDMKCIGNGHLVLTTNNFALLDFTKLYKLIPCGFWTFVSNLKLITQKCYVKFLKKEDNSG